MLSTVCLALTVAFGVPAGALMLLAFRREDGLFGLAGLGTMLVAAVPAIVYASVLS